MPKVVVGGLVRDRRVLLVHRSPSRQVYPGVWDLPGGHVEAGESELVALSRELHEELDVEIQPGTAVELGRLSTGVDRSLLLSAWLVGEWRGTPRNAAPEEHDEIAWFSSGQLPPLAHSHVRSLLMSCLGPDPLGR